MHQLDLFDDAAPSTVPDPDCGPDLDSERLVDRFRTVRLAQGAHPRSVRREVSQLRAVAREAGMAAGASVGLADLFADLRLVARALREPARPMARTTGRARLLAVQRFIAVMARDLRRHATRDIAALDALLPSRRSVGWHDAGTQVAGAAGRPRWRGPTLDAADLRRIVDAAAESAPGALVALHCFSGLRADEIVRLRWEDVGTELTAGGFYGLVARVSRGRRQLWLPLPTPAADALAALAADAGGPPERLAGPVFRARGADARAVGYRMVRLVVERACRRAGLPAMESVALRAACAHWLRTQGLSDHEVAKVLGLDRVRSVDRLLQPHARLDAQRAVRELLDR